MPLRIDSWLLETQGFPRLGLSIVDVDFFFNGNLVRSLEPGRGKKKKKARDTSSPWLHLQDDDVVS